MEKKFFEEKIRLQKEANKKISELALKAHHEAVANLENTTKSVYRENVKITEALKYHLVQGDDLQRRADSLSSINRTMLEEREMHDLIVKEKIAQSIAQNLEVRLHGSKGLRVLTVLNRCDLNN